MNDNKDDDNEPMKGTKDRINNLDMAKAARCTQHLNKSPSYTSKAFSKEVCPVCIVRSQHLRFEVVITPHNNTEHRAANVSVHPLGSGQFH